MKAYLVDEVGAEIQVKEVADLAPATDRRTTMIQACLLHAALTARNVEINDPAEWKPDPEYPGIESMIYHGESGDMKIQRGIGTDPALVGEPDFGYELQVHDIGTHIEMSGLWGRDKKWAMFYSKENEAAAREAAEAWLKHELGEDEEGA